MHLRPKFPPEMVAFYIQQRMRDSAPSVRVIITGECGSLSTECGECHQR